MIVLVGRAMGQYSEFELDDGATVEDALDHAGIDLSSGNDVTVNSSFASTADELSDGDRVSVVKRTAGAI